jgi:hypothetical protein
MLPADVVIPHSTTVLAIGPVTALAIIAVAVLIAILVRGAANERARTFSAPLHSPLAPRDREARPEAA